MAIAFILSPLMVKNHSDKEQIGYDLKRLYQVVAGFSTLVLFLVVCCKPLCFFLLLFIRFNINGDLFGLAVFKEAPRRPPSEAEAKRRSLPPPPFFSSFKNILSSKPFWLILFVTGISQGLYNAISTLLNQILLSVFPVGTLKNV